MNSALVGAATINLNLHRHPIQKKSKPNEAGEVAGTAYCFRPCMCMGGAIDEIRLAVCPGNARSRHRPLFHVAGLSWVDGSSCSFQRSFISDYQNLRGRNPGSRHTVHMCTFPAIFARDVPPASLRATFPQHLRGGRIPQHLRGALRATFPQHLREGRKVRDIHTQV